MHEVYEYLLAARPVAAYEALIAAVGDARFAVVRADPRHLTLAFRPGGGESGDNPTVLAALLDAGHGLCKLVLVGRDEGDGSVVGLTDAPQSLFADVEQRCAQSRDSTAGAASTSASPRTRGAERTSIIHSAPVANSLLPLVENEDSD